MFNKCLHASVLRNDSSIHLSSLLRWEFLFSSSCFCSRGCCSHIAFHFLVSLQIYTIFTITEFFSEKNITTIPFFQSVELANLHSSATVRFGFAEAIPHFPQSPSMKSAPPFLFYGALEYRSHCPPSLQSFIKYTLIRSSASMFKDNSCCLFQLIIIT